MRHGILRGVINRRLLSSYLLDGVMGLSSAALWCWLQQIPPAAPLFFSRRSVRTSSRRPPPTAPNLLNRLTSLFSAVEEEVRGQHSCCLRCQSTSSTCPGGMHVHVAEIRLIHHHR